MASPPYTSATSPPGPTSLSLPRQRPHIGLSLPPKHRKLSSTSNTYPTSAHPLRQTSFPPSEGYERDAFSPADSLDSLDDADIRSAVGEDSSSNMNKKRKRGEKRPRGRPPKDARANAARKAGSVNGSDAPSKRAGTAGATSVITHSDEEDEDEEGGGDGEGPGRAAGDFSLLPAEMDRDKQRKFLFREAVPPTHQSRYDSFNTVKLKAGEVRKLVNNVLSQSVPANVVTVVGSYTKMFAGMLIEAAREAQAERIACMEKRPDGEVNAAYTRLRGMEEPPEVVDWETESESDDGEMGEVEVEEKEKQVEKEKEGEEGQEKEKEVEEAQEKKEDPPQTDIFPDGDPNSADEKEADETTAIAALPNSDSPKTKSPSPSPPKPNRKSKKPKLSHPDPLNTDLPEHDFSAVDPGAWGLGKFVEDCDRGPLQPDDLREALRRYKRSRAGGSVGYTGISLEGREGVAARMGGRRMFR